MTPGRANLRQRLRQAAVVHHLPGRLRLSIPALEKLSPEWRRFAPDVIGIIKLKSGIDTIEISSATGGVLIGYNPDILDKEDIMRWFKTLAIWFYSGYKAAPFRSMGQFESFLKKMRLRVRQLSDAKHRKHKVYRNAVQNT